VPYTSAEFSSSGKTVGKKGKTSGGVVHKRTQGKDFVILTLMRAGTQLPLMVLEYSAVNMLTSLLLAIIYSMEQFSSIALDASMQNRPKQTPPHCPPLLYTTNPQSTRPDNNTIHSKTFTSRIRPDEETFNEDDSHGQARLKFLYST